VGWFTTVFPVHLALPVDPDYGAEPRLEAVARAVQKSLDLLPLRGAAHGLARYLAPDESLRSSLAAQPRPAVLFNLLGTHDVTLPPASRLRVTDERQGQFRDPDAARAYGLELNARVERGALIVSIEYSRLSHGAQAIARFAAAWRDALQGMAHGSSERFSLPGVDASSMAIVADLLAELDES
jgi:non-ribosomal peptide synthase protein (TIGR01720 family)